MLERSRRPFGDEDRALVERLRQTAIGSTRFDPKFAFLAGAAGLIVGIAWQRVFRWPIVVLTVAGAVIGFLLDYVRFKRERGAREAVAAAKWNPVLAVGAVERVAAEASSAARLDDKEGNTAWFLQVGDQQILCVWDWADHASERVELELVPGEPTTMKIVWSGKQLTPMRPTRRFKRGEREPEQCEVLVGTLEELDSLLRDGGEG